MDIKAEEERCHSVFPEKIWQVIADKSDFGAHLRLRESSPYLWNLLENSWIRWFPQFAEILYKQLKIDQEDVDGVMKKCRLVCCHWQKCVDAVLLNFPHPLEPTWYGHAPYRLHDFKRYIHPFDIVLGNRISDNTITRFRQHFETHAGTNRNPFLYRSIMIGTGGPPQEAGIDGVLQFLRDYGQHIWHCVFCLCASDNNIMVYYRNIYEMLKLMPNLQTLSLDFFSFDVQPTTFNELQLFTKTHPFPTLKHLKSQKIRWVPTSVITALTQANPQITKLDIYESSEANFTSRKENLQFDLQMQLEDYSTRLIDEQHFRMLKSYSFAWPLKHLYLQIAREVPTKELFEFLGNSWSVTLIELSLDFHYTVELLDAAALNLPNLQAFSLKSLGCTPLDFLLSTQNSLKTLSVRVRTRDFNTLSDIQENLRTALEAERIVKFLNFRNNLSESNIWSMFPKLQSVDYKTFGSALYSCRRFDWMLKQAEPV